MRYARGSALAEVPARTALVGNPSDAFGGAIITLALDELSATVSAKPNLKATLAAGGDVLEFANLGDLVAAGRAGNYPDGGPLALLMASAKRWAERGDRALDVGVRLELVESSIPAGVGLAGSSAIVVGALQALGELFGDEVAERDLPSFALACERDELGITGGLGDRVAQVAGGLVYLDLASRLDRPTGRQNPSVGRQTSTTSRIERLDAERLPPLFVAWRPQAPTHSGEAHAEVARRFRDGDDAVVSVMREIADLARQALKPILIGDAAGLGVLMDRNLELRESIYDLDPRHLEMVEACRSLGVPTNYTGSGGAVVGLFRGEDQLTAVRDALEPLGCEFLVRRPG